MVQTYSFFKFYTLLTFKRNTEMKLYSRVHQQKLKVFIILSDKNKEQKQRIDVSIHSALYHNFFFTVTY